jgi:hypothetical protein
MVVRYFNEHAEKTDDFVLTADQVYVVWFNSTLNNWKAMVSTTIPDGMYYEVTYNWAKSETYVDAYKKFKNVCVKDEDVDPDFPLPPLPVAFHQEEYRYKVPIANGPVEFLAVEQGEKESYHPTDESQTRFGYEAE